MVRLSPEDWQRYQRLLKRYGTGFHPSKSESFRALLKKLDFPYATRWDNESWDFDKEQPDENPEQPDDSEADDGPELVHELR
jgi:hypothetical protein